MKRSPALMPLSRDHHQALAVALRLRRCDAAGAANAADDFLAFWRTGGQRHFQEEEEVLLPAYAGYGNPNHPLVTRTLVDHLVIRQRARRIEREAIPDPHELQELGMLLASHVRFEERELFPMIEQTLPRAAASALAQELSHDRPDCER